MRIILGLIGVSLLLPQETLAHCPRWELQAHCEVEGLLGDRGLVTIVTDALDVVYRSYTHTHTPILQLCLCAASDKIIFSWPVLPRGDKERWR